MVMQTQYYVVIAFDTETGTMRDISLYVQKASLGFELTAAVSVVCQRIWGDR
ncbi:MAG: hypothetical protein U0930_21505 [Pirellulales bacterium]